MRVSGVRFTVQSSPSPKEATPTAQGLYCSTFGPPKRFQANDSKCRGLRNWSRPAALVLYSNPTGLQGKAVSGYSDADTLRFHRRSFLWLIFRIL